MKEPHCPKCRASLAWRCEPVAYNDGSPFMKVTPGPVFVWCPLCGWAPDTQPETLPETVGRPREAFKGIKWAVARLRRRKR